MDLAQHEAMFCEQLSDQTVHCHLCAHECRIKEGRRGLCGVRENRGGVLYSLVYGRLVSGHVDPVEKKPLFHFLPGSFSYSIATVGCNFHCLHCQNSEISQYPHQHDGQISGRLTTPAEVVAAACASGCRSISYTYVEPTIFFEFARDTAILAHEAGLANIFVSNGYASEAATVEAVRWLDANNIDLKSFDDAWYRRVCGGKLQPVLDSIVRMKTAGVWVEVTTLVIPGENDTEAELTDIARFIASVDQAIPWHVSRFHPAYRMRDHAATPPATLLRAREIGRAAGLHHVYLGNLPGQGHEDTLCPGCGAVLVVRRGFTLHQYDMQEESDGGGRCCHCGAAISGVYAWKASPSAIFCDVRKGESR